MFLYKELQAIPKWIFLGLRRQPLLLLASSCLLILSKSQLPVASSPFENTGF
jgi:hypothetical protein